MNRRELLGLAAMAPLCAMATRARALADAPGAGTPWHWFELHYEIDLRALPGAGRLWLPVPQSIEPWQRVLSLEWDDEASDVRLERHAGYGAPILVSDWKRGGQMRVSALVAVRERGPQMRVGTNDLAGAAQYRRPTALIPVDGIVGECAGRIVAGIGQPLERARAIYDWVVDNTFRDPKVRGCGTGNIRAMLETGNLGGKCADINALFVGLTRAAGIPAREVFGIRAGESREFPSLGRSSGDVSTGQHCRAEFFVEGKGWIPVDPADVRKVVLEEGIALDDARVQALRERLFGAWEMNWVAFNTARDFQLAPPARAMRPYLMYPYAEFGETVLDGFDPAAFSYRITSTGQRA